MDLPPSHRASELRVASAGCAKRKQFRLQLVSNSQEKLGNAVSEEPPRRGAVRRAPDPLVWQF